MSAEEIERFARLRDRGLISDEEFERQKLRELRGFPSIGVRLPTLSKRWILGPIVATAIAFAGWYFGGPYWTLHQISGAFEDHDSAKVVSYVEIPALRENLARQLRARVVDDAMESDNPFAALIGIAGASLVDGLIDTLVSEEGLVRLLEQKFSDDQQTSLRNDIVLERESFDRFVARVPDTGSQLVFERFGLGWKIVNFIQGEAPTQDESIATPEFNAPLPSGYPSADQEDISMAPTLTPEQERLVDDYWQINSNCRGGSGDAARTWHECARRDVLQPIMRQAGLCLGKVNEAVVDNEWHLCNADSIDHFRDARPIPVGRCRLTVDQETLLDGQCLIRLEDGGSFWVMNEEETVFGSVQRSDSSADALVSANYRQDVGGDYRPVTRKGACWSNESVEICAWGN